MKIILCLLTCLFVVGPVAADSVTYRTFTGWDHGYTLTIDGTKSTLILTENLPGKKLGRTFTKEYSQAKVVSAYLQSLVAKIKGESAGPFADDGRVIEITIKSGESVVRKTINQISPVDDVFCLSASDSATEVSKLTDTSVAAFKKWTEAYMVQQLLFELRAQKFPESKRSDGKEWE